MPIAIATHDGGYSQMDHQAQQTMDLARAGDVAAAQGNMTEMIRRGHLSGQDRQSCEQAIAQARERLATKRPAPKRKARAKV